MPISTPITGLELRAALCSMNKTGMTCKEVILDRMNEFYKLYPSARRFRSILEILEDLTMIEKFGGCYQRTQLTYHLFRVLEERHLREEEEVKKEKLEKLMYKPLKRNEGRSWFNRFADLIRA